MFTGCFWVGIKEKQDFNFDFNSNFLTFSCQVFHNVKGWVAKLIKLCTKKYSVVKDKARKNEGMICPKTSKITII